MWKVTNVTNQALLSRFKEVIILPLLNGLVEAKTANLLDIEATPSWQALLFEERQMLQRLRKLIQTGKSFQSALDQMLTLSINELTDIRALYFEQNGKVEAGQLNLTPTSVPHCVKEIFVDFFYEKFFNDSTMWRVLIGKSFSKREFVENFKDENRRVSSCPYCDLDTTNCAANNFIEHFLPKTKFPLLSMCSQNMIAACTACNTSAEGKGSRVASNVTSPLVHQIGDIVLFKVDSAAHQISIFAPPGRPDIDGYLDLISLPKRWGMKRVYETLTERFSGFVDTALTQATDRAELFAYFERFFSKTPMYFAARFLTNQIADYKKWP